MELISKEIIKIIVKKKKQEEKSYILHKNPTEQIIGLIPFFWNRPDINSYDKKLYLNNNNFLLELNNIITINVREKEKKETKITYKKHIKKEIINLFEEKYGYEKLKMKNIINILEICEGNIKIYLININKNKRIYSKISKEKTEGTLSLLMYYNNPEIKEDLELFENMYQLKDNKDLFNKTLSLYENTDKILELKLKKIYQKVIVDYQK